MSITHSIPIFITIAVFCCFSGGSPAAAKPTELATEVCKNTTDFVFCQHAIYSDPRAADADRVVLAYIAFGQAYSNASDTRDYIDSRIKSCGGNSGELSRLKKCLVYYNKAVQVLAELLGDLDSETYSGFDKLSLEVEGYARACQKDFGKGPSPLTKRNVNLIKLANISYVVSKLFEYH